MHPRIAELLKQNYDDQRSDNWYRLRNTMLTASDCASAIGDNFFKSPGVLVLHKVYPSLNTFKGNERTEWGQKYESVARDIYADQYKEVVHEIGLAQHPVHKWLGGSPDGITESGKLIEIKCPNPKNKLKKECPKHYVAQVQVLLEVLDLEECDFIQYRPDPYEFVVVNMKRDREWFAEKMPIMKDLWDRVIHGRKNGLSEFRDDTSIEDAPVSPLREAVVPDVPVQVVPEPTPVCELHPTRETFMSEFDSGQGSKLGTASKAASL
jgi:putative phage-type endonuclease